MSREPRDPGPRRDGELLPSDRRRDDRRSAWVGLGDYPVPELRKAFVTIVLLAAILVMFLYMVHEVLIGVLAGVVVGVYLLPFHGWLNERVANKQITAITSITFVTVPLVAILIYSWLEISNAADYLDDHRQEVAARINEAIRKLPFMEGVAVQERVADWVAVAASQTSSIVGGLSQTLDILVISIAVFLFTVFYILTDYDRIARYIRSKVPGRYRDLMGVMSSNVRLVVYGALYATFMTQIIKSGLILAMNLIWDVPLALVLAIVSFFIGFFPIVGSWSVYLPVAIYLMVFREDYLGGLLMATIGFFGNTILLSMYLRPKIAAEKSSVLNFYWMFIALITGVYTFGIIGIVIGPVLIAVLKAVFDSVTGDAPPQVIGPRAQERTRPAATPGG